jgi:ribosomal protein S18 acetylase RimI-like enzyme
MIFPDEIIIRKFLPEDLDRILEIEYASFSTDAFSKNTFLSLYRRCSDLFFVAEVNEAIAGYMVTCTYMKKAKIVSIAVAHDYRRKGIGSLLVKSTFNGIKNLPITTFELEVKITNYEGICFWKSLGFLPFKIARSYYSDGTNALVMRKLI